MGGFPMRKRSRSVAVLVGMSMQTLALGYGVLPA